jgi:hypothetical protein
MSSTVFRGYLLPILVSTFQTVVGATVVAEDEFASPPISYYESESQDPVARLWKKIKNGDVVIEKDETGSFVRPLLDALNIPVSSQCLVFSKTSMQIPYIGPSTPRAIYFNDSVYVGVVLGSPIIELTAVDPQLGCVFYTLEREDDRVQIIRDRGQCMSCHATSRTERVPGVLVRSIYSDRAGRPRSGSSTYITDHRSPFEQRWGGWYVTGTHGSMRHLGNIFALDREDPQRVDMDAGANKTELPSIALNTAHLSRSSDIVALMVLEHQTRLHNLITRANYEARQASYLDNSMNEALGRDPAFVSESTTRRIASVAGALVEGIFFANEFPLEAPVVGSSTFAEDFSRRGPHDSQGRSLFELDMKKRMFRFPCSYMILTDHFAGLPPSVQTELKLRVQELLHDSLEIPKGIRMTYEDRQNVRSILSELKPGWL